MADEIATPRRTINAQHPIEAPRVHVGTASAWAGLNGRNALSPKAIRPAPVAARAPRSDAGVTVPGHVVVQVLPSVWDAPAQPVARAPVAGGFVAEWLRLTGGAKA